MHYKSTKKLRFKETQVLKSFTSERLTSYAGLTVIHDYVNHLGLFKELDRAFSTVKNIATQILNVQLFISIIYASLCGLNRLSRMARFTEDPLVRKLLGLRKELDDSNIKTRLVRLGQKGAKFSETT